MALCDSSLLLWLGQTVSQFNIFISIFLWKCDHIFGSSVFLLNIESSCHGFLFDFFPTELWQWTPHTLEELGVDLNCCKTWVRPWKSSVWCPSFPAFHRNGAKAKERARGASFQSGEGGPGREFRFPESQVSAFLVAFITWLLWEAPGLLSNPEYWEGTILLLLISFHCTLMYNFSVFFFHLTMHTKTLTIRMTPQQHTARPCSYAQPLGLRGSSREGEKTKIWPAVANMGFSISRWWSEHISLYESK